MPTELSPSFSLSIFWQHPLHSLTFILFIISTISLWAFKRLWIWVPLLALTFIVGYYAKIIEVSFLIPITILCLCQFFLSKQFVQGIAKLMLFVIATILSFALSFHLFPDINNWLLASDIKVSPDAPSFNYYWNLDKPFIGFFVLAFQLTLLKKMQWKSIAVKTAFGSIFLIGFFIFLCTSLSIVRWDIKFPSIFLPWAVGNLFLTTIPEETFFRGFLLDHVARLFKVTYSKWLSNALISIVFALIHLFFVQSAAYLLLAFIASFIYGALYITTRSIESAIFAHYLLNIVHFVCFTYPILTSTS